MWTFYDIYWYGICYAKAQSKTEAKKKIRNSCLTCLAQWYQPQRNIILTPLIILTDVLFLSQKKRIFPFPCHLCKLKQAGDCFWLILIIKTTFSLSFHVFGLSAELHCFSDFVFVSLLFHCEKEKKMQMQNAFLSPFSLQFTFYHPCIHVITCTL